MIKDKIVSIRKVGKRKTIDIEVEEEHKFFLANGIYTHNSGASAPLITETELAGSFGKIREVDFAFSINQTDTERKDGSARLYVIKSRNARSRYYFHVDIDYKKLQIKESEDPDESEPD